ncbi:hypothetical protein I302_103177 [Kwoniella bestiolae CBS 10118]|uniref:WSC domain-containing protein n=1 Tax=Kwoniella bestiolae CBS 10118 TaxID=1296100 RepID=A0A1B9G7S8_9TREE|nr:hypothetical protein I302_01875 [Kwoniella bestiolae CBS 10118]OCF27040.1 hypothetical protein I302_01875 [Kwoniella bestiolae CBS 10118]
MYFLVALACLLCGPIQLIAAQSPVNLGCFTLPSSGPPPGDLLPTPARDDIDCARQCDTPTPNHDKWYGFFLPNSMISINCYCSAIPPPNKDYTACEDGNVYEAWQAESVFTFVNCFSSVCAANFQEFYVDTFDQCIGECFSNNWIITDIASNGRIHCRCGGSYEIPPYNPDNTVTCDNTPNNWRVYRYFGIGPSALAKRRPRSLGRRQNAGICPQGLTACKTPNGEGDGYEVGPSSRRSLYLGIGKFELQGRS